MPELRPTCVRSVWRCARTGPMSGVRSCVPSKCRRRARGRSTRRELFADQRRDCHHSASLPMLAGTAPAERKMVDSANSRKSLENPPPLSSPRPIGQNCSQRQGYLDRIPPRTLFLAKAFLFGMCHPLAFLLCCGLAGGVSGDARSDVWILIFLVVISSPFCGLLWVIIAASIMRYKRLPFANDGGDRRTDAAARDSGKESDDRIVRSPPSRIVPPHPDKEESDGA